MTSDRLDRELRLLYAAEYQHKIPAAPIVRQLVVDEQRGLPDVLPPIPRWRKFDWPASGNVNFESWWRDRDRYAKMMGPYL